MDEKIENYINDSGNHSLIDLGILSDLINAIAIDVAKLDDIGVDKVKEDFMNTYSKLKFLKKYLADNLESTKAQIRQSGSNKDAVTAYLKTANDNN